MITEIPSAQIYVPIQGYKNESKLKRKNQTLKIKNKK